MLSPQPLPLLVSRSRRLAAGPDSMRARPGKQAVRELARFGAISRIWIGSEILMFPRASAKVVAFLVAGGAFGLAAMGRSLPTSSPSVPAAYMERAFFS